MSSKKHERLAFRLSDIITRLNNGERLNIHTLTDEYQVCVRTLKRDFQERLATMDYAEAGPTYYQLNTSRIGHFTIVDIRRFAHFASIQNLLPSIDRPFFYEQINPNIVVKGFDYENIQTRASDFEAINQAIKDSVMIEFDYQKVTKSFTDTPTKHHRLAPYHLLNKNGIWYVVGRRYEQTRTFCFTQVSNLVVTDEHFDCDEAVKDSLINTDSLFFDNHIDEIVLQVDASVAGYFERRDLLPNQAKTYRLNNGDLHIICHQVHPREVLPIVQYWLPHVRVVSPIAVQKEMEEVLREYLFV